jgi:uncharacterized protein YyaL (SSP411 family)
MSAIRWLALAAFASALASPSACTRKPPRENAPAVDDPVLRERLRAAVAARGPEYVPHTRHKNADGSPKYTNRLVLESSPYLLQHAHNPVDWYPWGDEAFARARATGRPIFLSVGYSTCHWCHVMEEESFEDEEIAAYINEHYVPIKVDREERPDVDGVYMDFVQALTGGGGWPMSVWLTPAREPFFGGTYFPPRGGFRGARRGLRELLTEQAERFRDKGAEVAADATRFVEHLRRSATPEPAADAPRVDLLRRAVEEATSRFDPKFGGARGMPKFPSSFPTRLLLRFGRRTKNTAALRMATDTLTHMRNGGIYDQIGGGFHRYATDERWLVPHFEKMLYDNALLAVSYLEAAEAAGQTGFAETARETLDYLLRDMTAPDGTFYGATDADSLAPSGKRQEGAFFTWTPDELRGVLGDDGAHVAATWFDVVEGGNFERRTVLSARRSLLDVSTELAMTPAKLRDAVTDARAKLLEARAKRAPPDRDEKVLVAWNALAVSAFARAAVVLGEPRYADAAVRASHVLASETRGHRPLPHELVGGDPKGIGFADDHALLAAALLDVFELTSDVAWLDDAAALMEELDRSFVDTAQGGYFGTSAKHESLLVRGKPDYDGPVPSANSVAALTWLRLYELTSDDRFRQRADATIRAFTKRLEAHPLALDHMMLALDWSTDTPKELVVVVPEGRGALASAARALLARLDRAFVPNSALVVATESDLAGDLGRRVPFASGKTLKDGRATAYVCERGACKLPTHDPDTFARQLSEIRPSSVNARQ